MTACIRNLFYMAQDIKNLLWPSQLTAVVRGRDYDHAVKKAADVLVEAEAEVDCLEPQPTIERLFDAYWNAKTPEVETQALNDIDRYYPEWGAYSRSIADPAVPDPAAPSPQTPRGDDDPVGVTAPNAPAGSTNPGMPPYRECFVSDDDRLTTGQLLAESADYIDAVFPVCDKGYADRLTSALRRRADLFNIEDTP